MVYEAPYFRIRSTIYCVKLGRLVRKIRTISNPNRFLVYLAPLAHSYGVRPGPQRFQVLSRALISTPGEPTATMLIYHDRKRKLTPVGGVLHVKVRRAV